MDAKTLMFGDVEREMRVTRRVLERVPEGKFDWKPHGKSMTLRALATHTADCVNWMRGVLASAEMHAERIERPPVVATTAELLAFFDQSVEKLHQVIVGVKADVLDGTWTMKQGEQVMTSTSRLTAYRVWSFNHLVHHRGMLCVYLRLLEVPVPAVYFTSSDEPGWKFE